MFLVYYSPGISMEELLLHAASPVWLHINDIESSEDEYVAAFILGWGR